MTITEFNTLDTKEEREDIWKSLYVICLHADSVAYTHLITKACADGIALLLVRGDKINTDAWRSAFETAGLETIQPDQLREPSQLFYWVNQVDDIKGAVRWITDYYYPLKAIAEKRAVKEAKLRDKEGLEQLKAKVQSYIYDS